MQGVSTQSLAATVEALDKALQDGGDPGTVGDELFTVVAALDSEAGLRRVLTDPAVESSAKKGLLTSLLGDKVSKPTLDVLVTAATRRWNATRDLGDALEHTGVVAHVTAAERTGSLDELEDELFRFGRIVEGEPRLRDALGDRSAPLEAKRRLLDNLLADKASEPAQRLLAEAVAGRHRSFAVALATYQRIAAARRDRLVATVRVAAPLSEEHKQRLAEALRQEYSHDVHMNVVVDPQVLGGVRVSIGDEVIDSTIATRLADARRRLAG